MIKPLNSPAVQLAGSLLIAAGVFVAFLVGDGAGTAIVSGGLVAAFALAIFFGRRRSASLEVMSGIGDERTRHLYLRASAFTGSLMAFVLPVWWLVSVARGHPDATLNVLCAVYGFTWIAAAVVLSRRG